MLYIYIYILNLYSYIILFILSIYAYYIKKAKGKRERKRRRRRKEREREGEREKKAGLQVGQMTVPVELPQDTGALRLAQGQTEAPLPLEKRGERQKHRNIHQPRASYRFPPHDTETFTGQGPATGFPPTRDGNIHQPRASYRFPPHDTETFTGPGPATGFPYYVYVCYPILYR